VTNAAAGTHTVTITPGATSRASWGCLVEYTGLGIAQLNLVNSAVASTAQTVGSGSVIASSQAVVIAAVAVCSTVGTASLGLTDPPTGFTSLGASQSDVVASSIGAEASYLVQVSGGSQSATWSWTDANTQGSVGVIAVFTGTTTTVYLPFSSTQFFVTDRVIQ
jgi:hypothetical protein